MTDTKLQELSDEDRAELTAALKLWRDEGEPNPLVPMDYDADGDGFFDSWGLDAFGNLIIVSGAQLSETVFESKGGGVETGEEPI